MPVAVVTLLIALAVFLIPLFVESIDYNHAYLMVMFVFWRPFIGFNIYFLMSKTTCTYLGVGSTDNKKV